MSEEFDDVQEPFTALSYSSVMAAILSPGEPAGDNMSTEWNPTKIADEEVKSTYEAASDEMVKSNAKLMQESPVMKLLMSKVGEELREQNGTFVGKLAGAPVLLEIMGTYDARVKALRNPAWSASVGRAVT